MKLNIDCNQHKMRNKSGQSDKCNCKKLNRNFVKYLNIWIKTVHK